MLKHVDEILPKISLFEAIPLEELWLISPFIQSIHFKTDELLVKQGEAPPGVIIIRKGSVSLSTRLPNDSVIHIATLGPYEFMSEVALIESNPNTFSARAMTEGEGYLLTRQHLELLRIAYPDIGHHIIRATMSIISKRLADADQQICDVLTYIPTENINTRSTFLKLKLPMQRLLKTSEIVLDPTIPLDIFDELDTKEQQILIERGQLQSFDKGTILLHEEKLEDNIYAIASGAIEEIFIYENRIAKLNVHGPGKLIGQNSFLNFPTRPTRYTVREDAILLALNKEVTKQIKEENRLFWYKLHKNISKSYTKKLQSASKLLKRLHSEFDYPGKTEVNS